MLTLFSFLGGTAFRLIFGQVMEWLNKRQDHLHELASMEMQSKLEDQRHTRDMERIKLQSDLNVKEVVVQADAHVRASEAQAFIEAVKATQVKSGVAWVDGWNGAIRPAGATIALTLWVGTVVMAKFVLSEFDQTLIAAFIGVFVGERIHTKMRSA